MWFRKTLLAIFKADVALHSDVRHDDISLLSFSTFYFLIELSLLVSKIFVIYLASRGSAVGTATGCGEFESL